MFDPNRLLVVSHPVLATIGTKEIERAIPKSQRAGGWDHVEIVPFRAGLGELHEIDWAAALAEQEQLFTQRLQPEMVGRQRLAYFGFAPIPLALHLGYLVESRIKVDVYQRHHVREDWTWTANDSGSGRCSIELRNLPEHGSTDAGPVVVRVSTSYRIAPAETAEVVPRSLAEVDVTLTNPELDALETRGALAEVVNAFNHALSRLKHLFPHLTTIHLFAAVPVGLAFRLGTRINPTIHREVVTYQYWAKGTPCYRPAIVLGESGGTVSPGVALFSAAPSSNACEIGGGLHEAVETPDPAGHFLDQAEYDWSKPEAVAFHEIMLRAYGTESSADQILAKSGIDRTFINFKQPSRDFWKRALEVAARAGHTRKLARTALDDRSIAGHHRELDRLTSRAR